MAGFLDRILGKTEKNTPPTATSSVAAAWGMAKIGGEKHNRDDFISVETEFSRGMGVGKTPDPAPTAFSGAGRLESTARYQRHEASLERGTLAWVATDISGGMPDSFGTLSPQKPAGHHVQTLNGMPQAKPDRPPKGPTEITLTDIQPL